ncbi:MAG TPA: transglutaminase domain-containing protein [Burkholderiaceae bacterium]|nr:transglutaminase domain-containing protein [Burkholderiaceae bacterium]
MDRRTLLKTIPAAGIVAAAPLSLRAQTNTWRTFETTARLEIAQPKGQVRAWMPLPLSQDTDYFKTLANSWSGNAEKVEMVYEPTYRAALVSAVFKAGKTNPLLEVVSRFAVRERNVELKPGAGMLATRDEQALYLKATELMPTDGIVKKTADQITKGARTDLQKARAIYEWTVENTFRDPKTRGCGIGDVKAMLEANVLGGKCADLNAMFVALCRAAGVPARDVYGVRVVESPRGYKSMGRMGDITKAQHCRAEFYAQNIGWVPVDPADVRKVVLEERPNLTLTDDVVKQMRTFLFGNWEGNWLAYNYAHDVKLPGSKLAPVGFLMYPQAETAEGRIDSLDPDNFKYNIVSREVTT